MSHPAFIGVAVALFIGACGAAAFGVQSLPPGLLRTALIISPLIPGIWVFITSLSAMRVAVPDIIPRTIGTAFILAAMIAVCIFFVVLAQMMPMQ